MQNAGVLSRDLTTMAQLSTKSTENEEDIIDVFTYIIFRDIIPFLITNVINQISKVKYVIILTNKIYY